MDRIGKREWASRNPPKPGETREQYKQRYEDETAPGLLQRGMDVVEQAVRGGAKGLSKTGTTIVGGIGEVFGSPSMRQWARETEQEAQEFYNPQGTAGQVGEFLGRAVGEIGTSLAGGGLMAKGLVGAANAGRVLAPKVVSAAPRLASALEAASNTRLARGARYIGEGVEEGGAMRRALANVVANSPIDIAQGAYAKQGLVADSQAGAILENMLMSGAGGAMSGIVDARRAARVKQAEDAAEARRAAEEAAAAQRAADEAEAAQFEDAPQWEREMRTEQELLDKEDEFTDEAALDFLWRSMNKGKPLTEAELEFARKGPTKAGRRRRSGMAEAQALESITGGGLGGLYGYATGDTEEERLGRALAFGAGGALLPTAIRRGADFFQSGASARALEGKTIRAEETDVLRNVKQQPLKAPKMDMNAKVFPQNRTPLLNRMVLTPEERLFVEPVMTKVEPTLSETMTRGEYYRRVAKITGESNIDKLMAIDPNRATPEEAGAMLAIHTDIRRTITKKLEEAKRTADPDELARLTNEIEGYENTANSLLANIMEGDRSAGRALGARRYTAQEINDPTYWYLKGTKAQKGQFLTLDQKAVIDKLAAEGNTEELLQYMASIQKSSIPEQFAALRSAGLLTAIPGRIRDFMSTSANYAITTLQRYPGVGIDALLSKAAASRVGGAAEGYRTVVAPSATEFRAALEGTKKGLANAAESIGINAAKEGGFDAWVNTIRRAELDPDAVRRLELQYQTNIDMFSRMLGKAGTKADTFLDTYAKLAGRTSALTDKIIRGAALDGALVEQVALQAKRRGLKGAEAQKYIDDMIKNPDMIDDELKANAALAADYITFTNDGRAANAITNAIEGTIKAFGIKSADTQSLVRAGARIILPFRRTPANILSRAIEYTPGAGTVMALKAAKDWNKALLNAATKSAGLTPELAMRQRRLVDLMTKQASGLGMLALGAHYYRQGLMTGEMPENPAEREQWRLEGKRPESLLVGGQWLPIARISPFGNLMTMGASVVQNSEAAGGAPTLAGALGEAAMSPGETALTLSRSLLNQPMVTGPKEAVEALTGRDKEAEGYFQNLAGSFVPSIVAQAARSEGVQRQPEGIVQSVTSRIPGLQETAPERLNIFGEPVQSGGGVGTMISPLPGSPDIRETDPLVAEMARVKVNIGALGKTKGESPELYQYRQREAGKFVKEDLTALFQSPEYQGADIETQRQLIKDTVEKARRDLSDYLRENFGIGAKG